MLEQFHEDPIIRSFVLFVQTAYAVLKYTDAYLFKNRRLSLVKLTVLMILEVNGGSMEPSKIAEQTQREAHGISTLVRRMQRDNLVTIKRNEKDRRYVVITLTDEGRALLKDAMPAAQQMVQQIMLSIGEEGALKLENLLKILRQNAHAGIAKIV